MRRRQKFTRKERRKLDKELQKSLDSTRASVRLVANKTAQTVPINPIAPENIEHWMKYSLGSWKKGGQK